jgi:hypothetical protein
VRLLKGIGVDATGVDKDRLDIGDNRNGLAAEHYGSPCGFADLVICREVMEHLTVREVRQAVSNLCALSTKFVYVTTRYAKATCSLLHVETKDDLDPTHISMLNIDLLRTLFVLEGAKRRADLEQRMDWQGKGRVIVYQVA